MSGLLFWNSFWSRWCSKKQFFFKILKASHLTYLTRVPFLKSLVLLCFQYVQKCTIEIGLLVSFFCLREGGDEEGDSYLDAKQEGSSFSNLVWKLVELESGQFLRFAWFSGIFRKSILECLKVRFQKALKVIFKNQQNLWVSVLALSKIRPKFLRIPK